MSVAAKKLFLKSLNRLGVFRPFRWANRNELLILTYHRFSLERSPHSISALEFESHLVYIKTHYKVLSLSEAVEHLREGNSIPPYSVVLTIDDGYRDAFEIGFPILRKFDFPATLFVVTDFLDGKCWLWTDFMRFILLNTKKDSIRMEVSDETIIDGPLNSPLERREIADLANSELKRLPNNEREARMKEIAHILQVEVPVKPTADFGALTWEQACEMDAQDVRIESHTVSHPILPNVDSKALRFELETSKSKLEGLLDREVEHFCYPNGDLTDEVRNCVERAGYKSAVTSKYGFNGRTTDRFSLNRVGAPHPIDRFAQNVSGFEGFKVKVMGQ